MAAAASRITVTDVPCDGGTRLVGTRDLGAAGGGTGWDADRPPARSASHVSHGERPERVDASPPGLQNRVG